MAAVRSVQILNRIVLKWAPLALAAALVSMASASQAESLRAGAKEPVRAALTQSAKAAAGQPVASPRAAYASAEPACTTGRKRLWTDSGWIVRRITTCL
jgi:hypothetical protein